MKNKKYNTKNFRDHSELTVEHLRKDPKMAREFLKIALEEYEKHKNEKELLLVLKYITIANGGFAKLSKETGLSRTSLYKTLSKNGNPQFSTVKTILEFFGFSITFVAV